MKRIAMCIALMFAVGCEDEQLEWDGFEEDYAAASEERSYDPAPSASGQFNDAGELQCENVEDSFEVENTDTICYKPPHPPGDPVSTWAFPILGVCPPLFLGPINLNVPPATNHSVCQFAEIFVGGGKGPGPCALDCINRGVQISFDADAQGCTATNVRICTEP